MENRDKEKQEARKAMSEIFRLVGEKQEDWFAQTMKLYKKGNYDNPRKIKQGNRSYEYIDKGFPSLEIISVNIKILSEAVAVHEHLIQFGQEAKKREFDEQFLDNLRETVANYGVFIREMGGVKNNETGRYSLLQLLHFYRKQVKDLYGIELPPDTKFGKVWPDAYR